MIHYSKRINADSDMHSPLVLSGLLISYTSIAFGQMAGGGGRLFFIAAGLIILTAVGIRALSQFSIGEKLLVGILAALVPIAVILHAEMMNHQIDLSFTAIAYLFVSGLYLFCGFVYSKIRSDSLSVPHWLGWLAGCSLLITLYFERFVRSNFIYAAGRSIGVDDLNPISIGYNFMLLLLLCAVGAFLARNFIVRVLFSATALVALVVVVGSASRGPLLWGFIALLILTFAYFRSVNLRLNLKIVASIALFSALAFGAMMFSSDELIGDRIDTTIKRFTSLTDDSAGVDGTGGRIELWKDYFSKSDQWTVLGLNNYEPYPHNQFLELIFRFGLIGALLIPFSIYYFLKAVAVMVLKRYKKGGLDYLCLTIFIYCWLVSMSSLSLEMNRALWLGFGYVIGLNLKEMKRRPDWSHRDRNHPNVAG